ncbi:MAG TPA: hypothetical protein PKV67_02175 [Hyphomonas sp.]|nr:hypothetical protein [Hyphomonas sp.]HRK67381.1 hypothetical protein [Hyphomonas sp.]
MADSNPHSPQGFAGADSRAAAFVEARLAARAVPAYPGTMPISIAEAYDIQGDAIRLWPDKISGWKVGRINAPFDSLYGTDRLAGPIFSRQISLAGTGSETVHVIPGGFGAIEGEIVIEAAADAPASKFNWTLEEAENLIETLRIGVEVASSPLAEINDHGPLVTISDFGNNNGLILGSVIKGWRTQNPSDWHLRTLIDGVEAGAADAASIPGGPLESFRALLEICARRGLPIRRGMQISTGAVTGVHSIRPGQHATIEMAGMPAIECSVRAASGVSLPSNPA